MLRLLAQFGLTPKSKRGLASSDPVNADAWGGRQRAMETAQHRDRLPKDQPAEIAMFQISEVQESPVFNGRLSFLTLRGDGSTVICGIPLSEFPRRIENWESCTLRTVLRARARDV
jgi:hypothetical protein